MKSSKSIRRKSSVSGPFTPTGKRGSRPRRARWIAAAIGFLLAAPLAAHPQTGSTSSASVGISVSVAPSFKLKPSEEAAQNGAGYCIATNGEHLSLPVLLVDPSGGQQSAGAASALPWCGAGQAELRDDATTLKPAGLLIIRPE
jgi:hypothetical protein